MKRELVVGLVFAVLVGFLLGVTLWVENPEFFRKTPQTTMHARFREVEGLRQGSEVWIYGTKAGRVEEIEPDGIGGVMVRLLLDYDPDMREDHTVRIAPSSMLGGPVVAIHPGTPTKPAVRKEFYEGTSGSLAQEVGKQIVDAIGPIRETVEEARAIIKDVAEATKGGGGTIDVLLHDKTLAEDLRSSVANLRSVSDEVAQGRGTMGKLFKDETLHQEMKDAVAGLRKLTEDAAGGGGTVDVLLHDEALAADLKASVANIRGVSDDLAQGRGTLGRLLKDPSLYDRLDTTMKDLSALAADARSGKGAIGKLLYDEEFAKRLDTISEDIAGVTGKLRRGEGTLGKLINDETLYADIKDAVKKIGGGADDVRENAPILTFAGFLFSGF